MLGARIAAVLAFAAGLGAAGCTLSGAQPQPVQAGGFRAVNGLTAVPLPDGAIEVKGRPVRFRDEYWCAVGDYARRGLRLPWNTEIYVVRGIGPAATGGARSAVRFTTAPERLGVEPYQANWVGDILTPGYSRSVTAAFGNCRDTLLLDPLF